MTIILVLPATGTTGEQICTQLIKENYRLNAGNTIRCAVRHKGAPEAKELSDLGAECVSFDYDDESTWIDAFENVERALFIVPTFRFGFLHTFARLVRAAKEAGVKYAVNLSAASAYNAKAGESTRSGKQHADCDAVVSQAGFEKYAIVLPTLLMENFVKYRILGVNNGSKMFGSSGDCAIPFISGSDVAAVCAELMLNPPKEVGKSIVLTGRESLTSSSVARLLTRYLRRSVKYVECSPDELKTRLENTGCPSEVAREIVALECLKKEEKLSGLSPMVSKILGRPPETFESFLQKQKANTGSRKSFNGKVHTLLARSKIYGIMHKPVRIAIGARGA